MARPIYIYRGIALANILVLAVSTAASANGAANALENRTLQSRSVRSATHVLTNDYVTEEDQLLERAYEKFARGDYKGAIEGFTKVLAINPKNVDALANRALSRLNVGNPLDGLTDAEQAATTAPTWFFPRFVKGLCFEELEQFDSAVAQYTQSINLSRTHQWSYAHRGYCNYNLEKFDESIADLSKAISLDPNMFFGYWYRCWAYIDRGDLNLAKADADKMVGLRPDSGDSRRILALVLEKLGDKSNAIAEYKKAVELYKASGSVEMAQLALEAIARLEATA